MHSFVSQLRTFIARRPKARKVLIPTKAAVEYIDHHEAEKDKLRKYISDIEATEKIAIDKLTAKEVELGQLEVKLVGRDQKIAEQDDVIAELKAANVALIARCDGLSNDCKAKNEMIGQRDVKIAELQAELDKIAAYQAEVEAKEAGRA